MYLWFVLFKSQHLIVFSYNLKNKIILRLFFCVTQLKSNSTILDNVHFNLKPDNAIKTIKSMIFTIKLNHTAITQKTTRKINKMFNRMLGSTVCFLNCFLLNKFNCLSSFWLKSYDKWLNLYLDPLFR